MGRGKDPLCLDVIGAIKETRLFEMGERVDNILEEYTEGEDKKVTALREALSVSSSELERTARLFYVACTRAQNSLAVVAYTEDVNSVKETAISNGWFLEEEICIL